MVFIMILFFVVVYIVLAVLFVKLIKKFTKQKLFKWLAVVFVILLPTWDVVLGIIVYPIACKFIPKTAIYETAETEGIYYEGDYKNYIFDLSNSDRRVGLDNLDLEKGYKYMESLTTKKHITFGNYQSSPQAIYRCTPLPRHPENPSALPIQCVHVSNVQSEYVVKVKKVKMGITEMHFMNIQHRLTGQLMGEYDEVILWQNFFPFFNWLEWKWWGGMGISCPAKSRYLDFQYDVLKLKQ